MTLVLLQHKLYVVWEGVHFLNMLTHSALLGEGVDECWLLCPSCQK